MPWSMNTYTLIEQAKEELEMLEYQHPKRYNSLKQDLKAYISELESQTQISTATVSAATQESSSRKKDGGSMKKRRCQTDAVLQRAQLCLHKIHHFKTSFS